LPLFIPSQGRRLGQSSSADLMLYYQGSTNTFK
jgi:hypothetical protein